jgi:hypothetical protein
MTISPIEKPIITASLMVVEQAIISKMANRNRRVI